MEYIDNHAFDDICTEHPGLLDYIAELVEMRQNMSYEEGYHDGYRDGLRLPHPPYYDEEDNLVFADGNGCGSA